MLGSPTHSNARAGAVGAAGRAERAHVGGDDGDAAPGGHLWQDVPHLAGADKRKACLSSIGTMFVCLLKRHRAWVPVRAAGYGGCSSWHLFA